MFDSGRDFSLLKGLGDIVRRPHLKPPHLVLHFIQGRHKDHGNRLSLGISLEATTDLKPIHTSHHHI